MSKHASIGEAIRLLKIAYFHIGKESPPLRWVEDTEKFLAEHRDYQNPSSNYIVFRPGRELKGRVSKYYDGYWYDLNSMPLRMYPSDGEWGKAHPTGAFESRSNGELAEIWVVEPNENHKQEGRYW